MLCLKLSPAQRDWVNEVGIPTGHCTWETAVLSRTDLGEVESIPLGSAIGCCRRASPMASW